MIEEKVFSFIGKQHMIDPGDGVTAGISGGADSVCLLFLLLKFREKIPFTLSVVHVNHGIRESAGADERYVETLCKERQIPFFAVHADVPALSRADGESVEATGRKVRYRAFEEIAKKTGSTKIAVAHNSNDCSETLLFHLFRGTGIRGLSGIRPVRDLAEDASGDRGLWIIRPLLCLERPQIEAYLKERGIAYCTDETNESDHYTRNRIRHHILSCAEKEVSSAAVSHIAQTAEQLSEISDYLDMQMRAAERECVKAVKKQESDMQSAGAQAEKQNPRYVIELAAFCGQHPAIQKALLYDLLAKLNPHRRDISSVHVEALLSITEKEKNKEADLPFGIRGRREYGKLYLYREPAGGEKGEEKRKEPDREERMISQIPFYDRETGMKFEFSAKKSSPEEKKYTKWFDYDKIEKGLMLRHRKTGDYLMIRSREGGEIRKSLKDFMIDCKIPSRERGEVLLLADGSHILWIVGYRISEHYKVREDTKRVLMVRLET